MSPTPDDLNDPNVGNLGEDPEAFERRRLAQENALKAAELLNEAQADIPMRENFGPNEGESWDTPEMTSDAIARMKASRAPALARAHRAASQPTRRLEPPVMVTRESLGLPAGVSEELGLVIHSVVAELGRGLAQKFDDLKQDLEENTRLLGVMNAPMEAIADSHERATSSFETLRRDISRGIDATPAISALTKVIDTAGLTEAQSRAERRFEELARVIEGALQATRMEFKASIDAVAVSMVQVLHLLERLQARELREAKRRAEKAGT
jgi:hypothetical protein